MIMPEPPGKSSSSLLKLASAPKEVLFKAGIFFFLLSAFPSTVNIRATSLTQCLSFCFATLTWTGDPCEIGPKADIFETVALGRELV